MAQDWRYLEGTSQGGLSPWKVTVFYLFVSNCTTPKCNDSIWRNVSNRCANCMPLLCAAARCPLEASTPSSKGKVVETTEDGNWGHISTTNCHRSHIHILLQTVIEDGNENCPATGASISTWGLVFNLFQSVLSMGWSSSLRTGTNQSTPDKMSAIDWW